MEKYSLKSKVMRILSFLLTIFFYLLIVVESYNLFGAQLNMELHVTLFVGLLILFGSLLIQNEKQTPPKVEPKIKITKQEQIQPIEIRKPTEIEYISSLIYELSLTKKRDRKTQDKIDLLNIKLKQLKQ